MSPRPKPTRNDKVARDFLQSAAELIDAYLEDPDRPVGHEPPPNRLAGTRYPAALDWLRVEDVQGRAKSCGRSWSNKAFEGRWSCREEFLRDAVVYTILHYEASYEDLTTEAESLASTAGTQMTVSQVAALTVEKVLALLRRHPRHYLLIHIGPLLPQFPAIREALAPIIYPPLDQWAQTYEYLLSHLRLQLRPGWTVRRLALTLQAMMDGFFFRERIMPEEYEAAVLEQTSLFAEAVLAFLTGAIDFGKDGRSTHDIVDSAGPL